MGLVTSAVENLRNSNRRILVVGSRGTGKTTFSVSASRAAGETITGGHRACDDVLVVQGDTEGVMGAVDAGLEPGHVLDMTGVVAWDFTERTTAEAREKQWHKFYMPRLVGGLRELEDKLHDGTIKVVVVDLGFPAKLIERHVMPKEVSDWAMVAREGGRLYNAFAKLPGVAIIGNAHIKSSAVFGEGSRKGALPSALDTAAAAAIGGERASYTVDLPKGISALWLDNASFVFTRSSKRQGDGFERTTITQSTKTFEAKSRAQSKLVAKEGGEQTLHALLSRAYGAAL